MIDKLFRMLKYTLSFFTFLLVVRICQFRAERVVVRLPLADHYPAGKFSHTCMMAFMFFGGGGPRLSHSIRVQAEQLRSIFDDKSGLGTGRASVNHAKMFGFPAGFVQCAETR